MNQDHDPRDETSRSKLAKLVLVENEFTGSTLIIPFTALKHFGPKHHAIVLGANEQDNEIWIAELSFKHGYRLVSLNQWASDNRNHVNEVIAKPNAGERTNYAVASSAIREVLAAEESGRKYNVVFNNCETFADRHRQGHTSLSPQVKKTLKLVGMAAVTGAMLVTKRFRSQN